MKRHLLFLLCLLVAFACTRPNMDAVNAYAARPLHFREDGTFKILLFGDVHMHLASSPFANQSKALITKMLQEEQPDLAIYMGDAIFTPASLTSFAELATLCINQQTPYVFLMGNHDRDGGLEGATIFHLLEQLPYHYGRIGADSLSGQGNFDLPILEYGGIKTAAVLYVLDSHDTGPYLLDTYYDALKPDQIAWYRQVSDQYTAQNEGTPLPSMMFFHIPLLEYETAFQQGLLTGCHNESVSGPGVNTGMFDALVAQQDVMGVFVGHDHDNNYLAALEGILLGYANHSGYGTYGSLPKGARVIELYQNRHAFRTYIHLVSGEIIDVWP